MFANFPPRLFPGQPSGTVESSATTRPFAPVTPAPGAPPQLTPSVPPEEPPLATITSDLPEYGGSPSPRPDSNSTAQHTASHQRAAAAAAADRLPHSATSSPGRSRLEVVLTASPHTTLPGHQLWREADLSDGEDDLASPRVTPQKRKLTPPAATTTTTPHQPQDTGTKRPRGRPKGWRPGMPSYKTGKPTASAARYHHLDEHGNRTAAPPAPKGPPKRRGRPPRPPPPTARMVWESLAAPTYVPFRCEWGACRAELQNAETLRRHVRKVHGGGEGVCRWGACAGRRVVAGEGEGEGALFAHVERRHLVPLVWHVGDGARNEKCMRAGRFLEEGKGEDKVPAYLLGTDGRQVTPWVKDQREEDTVTRMRNRNRLRALLLQRDENAPLAEEDEEVAEEAEGSAPA